jgi:hypothetical protein
VQHDLDPLLKDAIATQIIPSVSQSLANLVPPVWEKERDLALQMRSDRLIYERQLQLHQNMIKQSHNLVWYSEVRVWELFLSVLQGAEHSEPRHAG